MANLRARRGRKIRDERAATLVEFALLAPLIFALILGMMTGGLALSRKNSMTNAVREGARFGATLASDDDWASNVVTRIRSVAAGDLSDAELCVALVRVGTAAPVRSNTCPISMGPGPSTAGFPTGRCVVKIWAEGSSDFEVIFFSQTLTLKAQSTSRFERGDSATCSA